jgi:hydrogenase maturation protein HypF
MVDGNGGPVAATTRADPAAIARRGADGVRRTVRLLVTGIVQGVGFRPFVYRLAEQHGLSGFTQNTRRGVTIELDGTTASIEAFRRDLETRAPFRTFLDRIEPCEILPPTGERSGSESRRFFFRASALAGPGTCGITPDLALCPDCRRDLFDPGDRRFRYPFVSCASCGPRYSILEGLPFDRERTSMREFPLCPACLAEYRDPWNRRFHAQTIACPSCGPSLAFCGPGGALLARGEEALTAAMASLADGRIVALKGIGGFQLIVDARSEDSVARLRARKHRPEKPLAVMFPTLAALTEVCEVSAAEAALLTGPRSPIVILRRRSHALPDSREGERGSGIANGVASGSPWLGAMLPYSPLHALLAGVGFPFVATSGNRSGDPLCTGNDEAFERLSGVADVYLVHDRRILRPVDDSVVRIVEGQGVLLRAARGYAPVTFRRRAPRGPESSFAVGGHMKSAVAVACPEGIVLSQHLGDLDSVGSRTLLSHTLHDLLALHGLRPELAVHDRHPDYASTALADRFSPRLGVLHHHAHVAAACLEHGLEGPVLGLAWDGTGLGSDGTLWGGEFLLVDGASCERVAHLRAFPLPGGERAILDPRRAALGLLWELDPDQAFTHEVARALTPSVRHVLEQMLAGGRHSPRTSAAGRLFDAMSALLGLATTVSFEGQAAMALEQAATEHERTLGGDPSTDAGATPADPLPIETPAVVDWGPLVREILSGRAQGEPTSRLAFRFHLALAEAAAATVDALLTRRPAIGRRVVLTGGCFQNALLLRLLAERLRHARCLVWWPERAPINDGGLALGQLAVALASPESRSSCA